MGTADIRFVEYYDTSLCYYSRCARYLYFKQLAVYNSTTNLLYVGITTPVNLQDVTQLEGRYSFTLHSNDIVQLRAQVMVSSKVISDSVNNNTVVF